MVSNEKCAIEKVEQQYQGDNKKKKKQHNKCYIVYEYIFEAH